MKTLFVGIAGGSGAGKSSLCTSLMDKYPDSVGLLQLDDYFKPAQEVPIYAGFENWDDPDALYIGKLADDMRELARGKSVEIMTKNERLNPNYKKTDKRIPAVFVSKPVMLVEGFLVLHDERIRRQLATSIWLDVDHDIRWARRVHFKVDGYEEKVLKPMYEKYALPSREFAQHVIDVTDLDQTDVLHKVEQILSKFM